MTWQTALYAEALQDLSPDVLSASCKQIIKDGERFPTPSTIRKAAKVIVEDRRDSRALANPDPNAPENFLARVKRVSTHDALWMRAHHGLLEQSIQDHMDGKLTDGHLLESIDMAERGLPAERCVPNRAARKAAE